LAIVSASCAVATESSNLVGDGPEIDLTAIGDPLVEPEVVGDEPDMPGTPDDALFIPTGDFAIIYLLADASSSSGYSDGLIPVARPLAVLSAPVTDLAATTIAFLLVGPTPPESEGEPAVSTAIPADTRLLGLTVADGVASIDLSAEFAAPAGPTARRPASSRSSSPSPASPTSTGSPSASKVSRPDGSAVTASTCASPSTGPLSRRRPPRSSSSHRRAGLWRRAR
jgi:hypothetical protein